MTRRPKTPRPAWTGFLLRTGAGIRGELRDQHGWTVKLSALMKALGMPPVPAEPPTMFVRTDPGTSGEAVDALRVELADGAIFAGELERAGGFEWSGEIAWRMHVIALTGTMVSPGRIELRGEG